jgi:hypothetical protein
MSSGLVRLGIAGAIGLAMAGMVGHHHGHDHTILTSATGATTSSANEHLGMKMAARRGWTGGEAACLDWLWTRESGWRLVWNTQGSGAFGIPQSLPASKMASAGPDYMTNPATQIKWGLGYIRVRYGSPCNAWAHETSHGWY